MKKLLLFILFFSCFATIFAKIDHSVAKNDRSVVIYFVKNSAVLDLKYRNNGATLQAFVDSLNVCTRDSVDLLSNILFLGAASPDGNRAFNERLAKQRARVVYEYIVSKVQLPDSVCQVGSIGRDWHGLIRFASTDTSLPHQSEVLNLLPDIVSDSVSRDPLRALTSFKGGEAYNHMLENYFPLLRATHITISVQKLLSEESDPTTSGVVTGKETPATATDASVAKESIGASVTIPTTKSEAKEETTTTEDTTIVPTAKSETKEKTTATSDATTAVTEKISTETTTDTILFAVDSTIVADSLIAIADTTIAATDTVVDPIECESFIAIKSNLLYDAAITPNIALEVYLGKGFSISASWQYAWWKRDKSAFYWRIYGGDAEVRYWFGKEAKEKPLTGHHVGVYGQLFTYDFIFGRKGVLAPRWSWAVGASYGYSLPIHEVLNLDFVVGLGYHSGIFKEYELIDDHYAWQATKRRHWVGPTKAEITLVWLIGCDNYNRKTVFDKKQKAIEETVEALVGNDKGGAL